MNYRISVACVLITLFAHSSWCLDEQESRAVHASVVGLLDKPEPERMKSVGEMPIGQLPQIREVLRNAVHGKLHITGKYYIVRPDIGLDDPIQSLQLRANAAAKTLLLIGGEDDLFAVLLELSKHYAPHSAQEVLSKPSPAQIFSILGQQVRLSFLRYLVREHDVETLESFMEYVQKWGQLKDWHQDLRILIESIDTTQRRLRIVETHASGLLKKEAEEAARKEPPKRDERHEFP
ncbi:MAG: hypothetical protein M5U26_30250 [Planctomycetota bacterium]|nr:hypothetical protein [Planctomycetota bacterium]